MLWVHFCTVGCRQMLIDCVIDFHSYSKISSLNSNNALILNGFKININLIFSMFMSLRPISAHCQNQYASCQDSKTLLSCSLTVPFINSFIQSFIYVINVCWFPTITESDIWLNGQFIYFDLEKVLSLQCGSQVGRMLSQEN